MTRTMIAGGHDEPLTYDLITDGRRLFHLWSDGTLLPVVRGGSDPSAGGGTGGDSGAGDAGSGPGEGSGGAGDAGGSGAGGDAGSGAAGTKAGDGNEAKTVTMTQAELDELINKRVAKATKASETAAAEKAARDKLDETERLKAEKTDADNAAKAATERANARLVLSDAKVAAVAAGVQADRVDRFMKVIDLSDIEVDDDGQVDAKAVKKAIDAGLKDVPEFKAEAGKGGRSGGEMNGNGGKAPAKTLEDAVAARYAG